MLNVIHRLTRNMSLVLGSSLIARGASAILLIVVARRLSQEQVGIYSLAVTYSVIAMGIVSWGLDQILIRDVARKPSDMARYLSNFFVVRLGLASATYACMWLGLKWFHPYVGITTQIILIIGLSVIPDSLSDICQASFIAHERLFYPSLVTSSLALMRIGLGLLILLQRPDLVLLAWVFPLTSMLTMLASVGLVLASGNRLNLKIDRYWLKHMLTSSMPLAVINTLLVLEVQAAVILLSLQVSETAVGIYGAANAIFTALSMVPYAWQTSIFPLMSRLHARADGTFEWFYNKLYLYLATGALGLILGFITFADLAIKTLYGPSFAPSASVLQILVAVLFFSFLNIPNSRLMLILNRQDMLAIHLLVSVIANLAISWLLIPFQGVIAIAIARLFSSGLFFTMNYLFVQHRVRPINLLYLLWRPLAAGLGTLAVMIVLQHSALVWRAAAMLFSYSLLLWLCKAIPREDLSLILKLYRGVA